jgi:hypothetical protein
MKWCMTVAGIVLAAATLSSCAVYAPAPPPAGYYYGPGYYAPGYYYGPAYGYGYYGYGHYRGRYWR